MLATPSHPDCGSELKGLWRVEGLDGWNEIKKSKAEVVDGGTYDHVTLKVNVLVLHAKYVERLQMDFTIEDAGRLRGHVIGTVEV